MPRQDSNKIGLPNVGILLDFGHSLFRGQVSGRRRAAAIDYGRLFGMDVNDAVQKAQDQHDALTALRLAQQALFSAL